MGGEDTGPEAAGMRHGPLHGVRVLDLTTVVMGPSATQMLGDLGADVIKVETDTGDSMRHVGPFKAEAMGPLYLQANRNKRSVKLDLKTEEGMAALHAMLPRMDVLVSNIRPQAMVRLGLGYEAVAAINPAIIYVAAVGYGAGGPDAGKAVYDDLMQAASGFSGLFARVDGAPRYAPVNICDRTVGLHVVIAVLAALHHRLVTGEGQAVEVPMFETMAQFMLADHMGGAASVPPIGPMGYRRLLSRTRGPYPTADGHLAIVVYTDKHWRAFSRMVGKPDLMRADPRFASLETRTQHAEEMGRFLADHMPMRGTREWIALLEEADIPCSPVNAIEDLFEDPHLKAVGLFEEREHPALGTQKVARFPINFSRSPATIRRLAPLLGEHTDDVRAELARDEEHG